MARSFDLPEITREEFDRVKVTSFNNWKKRFEDEGLDINSEYCKKILSGIESITFEEYRVKQFANTIALLSTNFNGQLN